MSRMSAYRLRRAPHAAAFARAWDVARERAGTLIEDIAFERAIEGVEEDKYTARGELADSKRVYNDRLLTFLLSHLKPERYSREARQARAAWHFSGGASAGEPATPALADACEAAADGDCAPRALMSPAPAPPTCADISLDDALRAMEPVLPAPAETMFEPEQLEDDLLCAEIADGKLPHFHSEQRPAPTREQERARAIAEQIERGRLAEEKERRGERLSEQETIDLYAYIDPTQAGVRRRRTRD